ncbi:protein phosphatase 4 regulatory subunit 3 [Seminavis robusta]|uniref:Protein phosphatase 4 regulatory subunit 3 n=1 Tax=Seminavis robusta TaxID=568900 RepID=A0A9N8DUV6_9STRA|nr:protein phosphatase 4 regulatory subunit 3 [Seminavis robusta]|eukprot:Sro299_g111330.1 protein phosphatase 4 regulatory subunit 3 (1408) ;mRNA; f:25390-30007
MPDQTNHHGGGGGGFRMEVKQQQTNRKRKRAHASAALSADEFGGGGEERAASPSNSEASTVKTSNKEARPLQGQQQHTTTTTAISNNNHHHKRDKPHQQQQPVQQPEGWRVKLYRLNADGSWDDCGTGRVACLRRPTPVKPNTPPPILENTTTATAKTEQQTNEHTAALDAWICQELGEPTLCMHAEVVNDVTPPKILLRTRILLRDAYQRQGDNIITWCEPYYDHNHSNTNANHHNAAQKKPSEADASSKNSNSSGVDLALSFQDNAGCLDIWRQITTVQRHAAELYRRHQQQQQQQQQQSQDGGEDEPLPANDVLSVQQMAQKIAQDHHDELERQQNHEMWVSMTGSQQQQQGQAQQQPSQHPLPQQQSVPQPHGFDDENNSGNNTIVHHHHHHGRGNAINNNNTNNANAANNNTKQQQQQHMDHHHGPFGNGDDGGADLYAGGSPNNNNNNNNEPIPNNNNNVALSPQLPNPPTLANLEEIADTIARVQHIQQRESLAMFISQNECAYLKSLLSLFPSAEDRGDYGSLATLAACVKTILLLNDPSILELIVAEEVIFEEICATLEYDPDLRDKANHRWFLRERARFRTVVLMEDAELVAAIHRAFRVNYLRDTLLRPTMDESTLSTLSSLQTFTHADVVKGVTMSPPLPQLINNNNNTADGQQRQQQHHDHEKDVSAQDSYLVRVIRVLGVELHALCHMEWTELENRPAKAAGRNNFLDAADQMLTDPSIVVSGGKYLESQKVSATWRQHLAPQDGSLVSRRIRRRGCLTFLRELFNMVRISLQQSDKDNFFSVIVSMEIEVMSSEDAEKGGKISDNESQTSKIVEVGSVAASEKSERFDEKGESSSQHLGLDFMPLATPVNLLSLLGTVLSDPNTDVTEKGLVLEIIAGVAMHDPGLIRRHCLEFHSSWKRNQNAPHQDVAGLGRPEANEKKQVIFLCPPNDLLAALLYLLDAEIDAGILLQVSEIMRIILDTDMMGEHVGAGFGDENGVFADEAEGIPPGNGGGVQAQPHEQHNQMNNNGSAATTTEQKQFLSMFYEHFIDWVVAPFQFTILHPLRRVPDTVLISQSESPLLMQMMKAFKEGVTQDDGLFRIIPRSAIRTSFAVELLSFCVRAHLYRMKIFLLKSRVLSNVLKLLKPHSLMDSTSGDRCLKLAALRFLRAILSVNDEFYHRHIIHHNLFEPVFEAFRANPVGDNLVSSAIVEMCDFIHNENINSLMEYIVTKHLSVARSESAGPSLEDVSSPYVSTLTNLREAYETARQQQQQQGKNGPSSESENQGGDSRYFSEKTGPPSPRVLSGKALEDQRKFQEEHAEESYFDSDDEQQPQPPSNTVVPPAVDEVAAQEGDAELHRPSRMFALSPAPILNHGNAPLVQENQPPQQETPIQGNNPTTGRNSETLDGKIS